MIDPGVDVPTRSTVGIVFVNFHSDELIVRRARRLQAAGFPVLVADNSGTFTDPGIESFFTGGNVGFGVACNLAVARLPAKIGILCFHNPDLDVDPASLDQLAQALLRQSLPGVAAATEIQNGVVRARGYRYPSVGREVVLAGAVAVRRSRSLTPADAESRRARSTRGRRFGGGGLWVVDRTAFNAVGGFDDSFFLYAEDLDLWHRFGLAGLGTLFCPAVEVFHRPGTGSAMGMTDRELLRWLGVERFEEKFGRPGAWQEMRLVHRALLPAYRRRSPQLTAWVAGCWAARLTPGETQYALRMRLEGCRAGHAG